MVVRKDWLYWLFIFQPLIVYLIFTIFDLEFIWYFDDNARDYDLIYSIISFALVIFGVMRVLTEDKALAIVIMSTIFIVYQTFSFNLHSKKYIAIFTPDSERTLILKSFDMGAFTTTSFANLQTYERRLFMFIQKTSDVESYDQLRTGIISWAEQSKSQIKVKWGSFDGESYEHIYSIDGLF